MRATAALALLLFRHWSRASLPSRLRRDKGRRASAGIFRVTYFGFMSAWGYSVGHLVSMIDDPVHRLRGTAWILVGMMGLAAMWSALTRGPTLRGEASPLEARFLDSLPIRDGSRLVVGVIERVFVYALGGASLVGVCPDARGRALVVALLFTTAGVFTGEAMMRVARIVFRPMTIARARSYLLVLGQLTFLMCLVQAPTLARSTTFSFIVAGWPSKVAEVIRGQTNAMGFVVLIAAALAFLALALGSITLAERIGYDKVDLVPTDRPKRSKGELLVVDRIDDVLRHREPGRWGPIVMMVYTLLATAGLVAVAWNAKKASAVYASETIRGICSLAAFGAFVSTSVRAARMAMRDVTARPLLAPLPIEPRALLSGKVSRLRRDSLLVALPALGLLATPWSLSLHLEIAWRVAVLLVAVIIGAHAGASIAFLTVGAGNKKGPGGSFVVESILVLVPLVGIASAPYFWSSLVPLAALALVAREANRSALGCVRWLDDGDDFERETPIWRALLVLGAFQSVQALTGRVVGLAELDEGTKLAIAYAASSIVLVSLTLHARRDAPSMRALPLTRKPLWLLVGLIAGAVSGTFALGYLRLLHHFQVELPETPSSTSRIAIAVMAVGLAPFAEEIFFRGWLFPCIEDELTTPKRKMWLAPLITAFAFAAVHPPLSFVPVLILGLATSFLFARTRSLGPSIAAHLVHNAIAVVIASG